MRTMALILLTATVVACDPKTPEADWNGGGSWNDCDDSAGGCDTGGWGGASFNIAWSDVGSTLEVSVSNPDVDGYFFGLAETGSGALGWYGEDCVSDDAICHDMGASNSLSLSSVHPEVSGLSASASRAAVVAGGTTLFHVGLWAGVTYAFFSNEGNTGYETVAHSGGDDSSFYE